MFCNLWCMRVPVGLFFLLVAALWMVRTETSRESCEGLQGHSWFGCALWIYSRDTLRQITLGCPTSFRPCSPDGLRRVRRPGSAGSLPENFPSQAPGDLEWQSGHSRVSAIWLHGSILHYTFSLPASETQLPPVIYGRTWFNQSSHARHLRADGQIEEDNFGGQRPIPGWMGLHVTWSLPVILVTSFCS